MEHCNSWFCTVGKVNMGPLFIALHVTWNLLHSFRCLWGIEGRFVGYCRLCLKESEVWRFWAIFTRADFLTMTYSLLFHSLETGDWFPLKGNSCCYTIAILYIYGLFFHQIQNSVFCLLYELLQSRWAPRIFQWGIGGAGPKAIHYLLLILKIIL